MTIASLIDLLSAIVVLLALVSAAATLASTRQRGIALAVLLDLLTAAGLLHLAADPSFMRAASAAIVLAVRHLVSWSLSNDGRSAGGGKSGFSRRSAQVVHVLTISPFRRTRNRQDDIRPAKGTRRGHGPAGSGRQRR